MTTTVRTTTDSSSVIPKQDKDTASKTSGNEPSGIFSTVSRYAADSLAFGADAFKAVKGTAEHTYKVAASELQRLQGSYHEYGFSGTVQLEAGKALEYSQATVSTLMGLVQHTFSYANLANLGSDITGQTGALLTSAVDVAKTTITSAKDYAQSTQAFEHAGNAFGKVADAFTSGYDSVTGYIASTYNTASEKTSEQFQSFTSSLDKNWLPLTVFAAGSYFAINSSYNAYTSLQNGKIGQAAKQFVFAGLSGAIAATVVHSAYVKGSENSTKEPA